ncbi:MAG: ABC transporter permease [Verrucomicrobiae bacterium]|nr:ABC transporter permease [Verrucomicrobiae bacterium]
MNSEQQFDLVIAPGRTERNYWRDLWRYREMFYFLAWRDILVRYKQTVFGVAWALVRPLVTMIVFTFVFGRLARLPSEGVPYPVMVFAGMLPWQFFAAAVSESANSLLSNANLVSKVYFPRLIVPAAALMHALVDFLISAVFLLVLMGWYGCWPDARVLAAPLFLLLACAVALGPGLWLCALNVRYRDFRYLVPFLIQLGLYISPVGFSSSVIPQQWRLLYSVNPMVGVIDGFRWCLLRGSAGLYWPGFVLSVLLTALLLWGGLRYFRRTEKTFADVI